MPARMSRYYAELRRTHPTAAILPMAVYLRVAHGGIGVGVHEERFGELVVLRSQFRYVGLPGLSAEEYVAGDRWLGVALAALMAMDDDRRAWLRAEALRRLAVECREDNRRRCLLFECVEAYLNLDGTQKGAFERLLDEERYRMVTNFGLSSREQGILIGRAELLPGLRDAVLDMLAVRFGAVPADVESAVAAQEDGDILDGWRKTARSAADLAAFRAAVGLPPAGA